MDPVRIALFAVAFVLLLLLGRILSARSEVLAHELPRQSDLDPSPGSVESGRASRRPAITGAEFGFPVAIPAVRCDDQGKFNRPYFLNYHFGKTDLEAGPADATCFCDDFFLQAQDPESEYVWTYKYLVATPPGLQQVMNAEGYASLYFDTPVVVVARWDLKVILSTVVEEIIKNYGKAGIEEGAEDVAATE